MNMVIQDVQLLSLKLQRSFIQMICCFFFFFFLPLPILETRIAGVHRETAYSNEADLGLS